MQNVDLSDTAQAALTQSKSFLTRQLDSRATEFGKRIGTTADDLRRIGGELRDSTGVAGASNLADRGADALERVGSYLEKSDGDTLIADLEDLARARPWTVATAALAAGFAASRFIKSSSVRRYRSAYDTDNAR